MTLLAEDLLLLLVDDATGKPVLDRTRLERVLAGAVLVELMVAERLGLTGSAGPARSRRIVVLDFSPTGDDVLDEALTRLAGAPLRPGRAVEKLVRDLRQTLLARIVAAGLVREERGRALGVFPTTAWPAVRPDHEARIRAQLRSVLVDGSRPDARISALVALLTAVDAVPKVVAVEDRRALVRRARSIAEGDWAARAVREAVDAVHAAVIAGVTAAT